MGTDPNTTDPAATNRRDNGSHFSDSLALSPSLCLHLQEAHARSEMWQEEDMQYRALIAEQPKLIRTKEEQLMSDVTQRLSQYQDLVQHLVDKEVALHWPTLTNPYQSSPPFLQDGTKRAGETGSSLQAEGRGLARHNSQLPLVTTAQSPSVTLNSLQYPPLPKKILIRGFAVFGPAWLA